MRIDWDISIWSGPIINVEKEEEEEEEEEDRWIGNAVADLQPVLGLTWLGLGCSLTDLIKYKKALNRTNNRT